MQCALAAARAEGGDAMARAKSVAFLSLSGVGAASVAVMLLVSVTRWFLPGIVELSAAFAVAALLVALPLGRARGRSAVARMIDATSWRALKFAAAGVLVLVLSAAFALFSASFPWPVSLLAGVLIVLIGAADSSARQSAGGGGGGDSRGSLFTSPQPPPSGLEARALRPVVQAAQAGRAWSESRPVRFQPSQVPCNHRQTRGRGARPAGMRCAGRRRARRSAASPSA
jgi:hypothetical protein